MLRSGLSKISLACGVLGFDIFFIALLEDEIKLPQTEKIILQVCTMSNHVLPASMSRVGCHDHGYIVSLHSQITAGFKQKLNLLRGYIDMATGFNELKLPTFSIPDPFVP